MIELNQFEIAQVCGGMKWCYGERSSNVEVDDSVSEDTRMQWAVSGGDCGGVQDMRENIFVLC